MINEGIPCFDNALRETDARIDRETEDLFDLFKQMHWKEALEQKIKPHKPLRFERLVYDKAADWMALLNLGGNSRILDAGCGWGTLTFQLAGNCESIYAMDSSRYAVKFVQVRSRQDGYKNVFPLRGNVLQLPFPDNFFDLVVLNGVLEWIGCADEKKHPVAVQKSFLKEISRVLNADGQLYVGIENRYSATYFLGQKEGHVNLRFISLLPRAVADAYHRWKKKTPFRVYTHSLNKYLSIFKECGFDDVSVYAPIPQYQKFSHLIPLDNINAITYYIQHMFSHTKPAAMKIRSIVNMLGLFKIIKYFVPCFSFIARKHRLDNDIDLFLNEHHRLFSSVAKAPEHPVRYSYTLYSGRNNILAFPFNNNDKKPMVVVKVSRQRIQPPAGKLFPDPSITRPPAASLTFPPPAEPGDSVSRESDISEMLFEGWRGNNCLSISSTVSGAPLEALIRTHKHSPATLKKYMVIVSNWLSAFQRATNNSTLIIDHRTARKYFDPMIEAAEKHIADKTEKKFILERIKNLEMSVDGKRIPLVTQHRDFGPSNILVLDKKIAVIDWELAQPNGEPLYDLFYFLSRFFFLIYSDRLKNPTCDFPDIALFSKKIFFNPHSEFHQFISDIIRNHIRAIGVEPDTAKMLFLWQEIEKNRNYPILNLFFNNEKSFCL
jgi:ubiquinone/menaquinone biosynthesis C-methylase UbiE